MKHKGSLTISRPQCSDGSKYISIRITDDDARVTFVELQIDYDKFTEALTGLSESDCTFEVRGLENVGKTKIAGDISVCLPYTANYSNRKELAIEVLDRAIPEGWCYSTYFGSKSSFTTKDGLEYVNTQMYRWVDKGEDNE